MLPSSRVLTHAPWRPVVTGLAHKCAQNLPQRLNYSVAVARPHPGLFLEAPEERNQLKSVGANITRNYATFSQTLQQLVEEGRYELAAAMLPELRRRGAQVRPHPVYAKAVSNLLSQRVLGEKDHEVLVHWLQLLPDARQSHPLLSQGLLDDIRHHGKADSAFIRSAGQVFARKGYKGLVEDEILPLARASLDNDTFASFEQELSRHLAEYVARINSTSSNGAEHSEVFEDAPEDYASVMAASAPPPPSVLELVEATLPQILPAPNTASQSVFEDEMDEDYLIHQPTVHQTPRQSPTDQLLQLVEDGKYNDAYHLLKELKQLHITIPFSHTYETVALESLRRPLSEDYTTEDQLGLLTTWLSLVPTVGVSSEANSLRDIQREIMHSSITSIPLVMRFCSILVEKGYATLVGNQDIAVAMRFAPADEVVSYIEHLEAMNSSYWNEYRPNKAAVEVTQFSGKLRSRAIRNLAYAGRVKEAIALLPERDSGIQITASSCNKLFRTIYDTNNPSLLQHIPRIEQAAGPSYESREKLRNLHAEAEDNAMAMQLQTSQSDMGIGGTLPESLRYLRHALRKAVDHPHPFAIAEFLERYFATGRTRAPTLLLNLATNTGHRSMSIFLFAEMLYYRRMGQHHLIIQTFIDHFYLSGVPRENVMKIYHETRRLQTHAHSNPNPDPSSPDDHHAPLTRICNLSTSILPRGKAWPMKIHCNLVWHALVSLTPTHPELENLYTKLRNLARGHDPIQSSSKHLIQVRPLLPPPSWRQPIDHAAFTPFMRRLMLISGPNRGLRIINDMIELGIQPSVYHYTELAGFFARLGDVEPTMNILEALEKSSGLYERLAKQKQDSRFCASRGLPTVSTASPPSTESLDPNSPTPSDHHSQPQVHTVPEPDLVFYVSLLRGFILSKSIEGFEKVHARLKELQKLLPKKRFSKDQDAILDKVYADFRALSRQQAYDHKSERKAGFVGFMKYHKAQGN